jgi:hypothetical protein
LSRLAGAAALARARPVRLPLEQQERPAGSVAQGPQTQERLEPERRGRTAQEPELRGVAQHYQKKK